MSGLFLGRGFEPLVGSCDFFDIYRLTFLSLHDLRVKDNY